MRTGAAVRVRAARVPRADPLHRIPIHTTRAWIQRRDAITLYAIPLRAPFSLIESNRRSQDCRCVCVRLLHTQHPFAFRPLSHWPDPLCFPRPYARRSSVKVVCCGNNKRASGAVLKLQLRPADRIHLIVIRSADWQLEARRGQRLLLDADA